MDYIQPHLSATTIGKPLHVRLNNLETERAWIMGDLAYDLGDSFETGVAKAARAGIRPGSTEYAAYITAFSRRLRAKQVSPEKSPEPMLYS